MTVPNLWYPVLRCCELEIKSDTIAQRVFHKQVLPPDILTMVTIGKYTAELVPHNDCTSLV
jgi:hypothetical protein